MSKEQEGKKKKRDRLTLNLDIAKADMNEDDARSKLKSIAAMCGFTWGGDGNISGFIIGLLKLSPSQQRELMKVFRKKVDD